MNTHRQIGPATKLIVRLHGSFSLAWSDGTPIDVRGAKHRALLAMLITAAQGTHSRSWLQDTLWGRSGTEHGRASLRRALSDLRRVFGDPFDDIFTVSNIEIQIDQDCIQVIGDPRDGQFLEGLNIAENGFQSWLMEKRNLADAQARTVPGDGERIAPSVAVIPFVSKSRQVEERHLADLLALEITRALSRSRLISVISHLSSRQFEQHVVDLATVRSALGIDYLAYGTLRLDGDNLIVDADFTDAENHYVQWTESFSGSVSSLLKGDNDIVGKVAGKIGQSILSASVELAHTRPLPDVASHALLMSAIAEMNQLAPTSFKRAKLQLNEVIARAPNHSTLHAWLGMWHVLSVNQGLSENVVADTQLAAECTARALDINPLCPFSLTVDGMVHNNLVKRFDLSARRFDEAIHIDPNNALAWLLRGTLFAFMGDGEQAVKFTDRARFLAPLDPNRYFYDSLSATARLSAKDYEGALDLADSSYKANHRHTSTLRVRTIALQKLGRMEEARKTASRLLELEPNLTVKSYLKTHPAANFETGKDWASALRDAGIPQR